MKTAALVMGNEAQIGNASDILAPFRCFDTVIGVAGELWEIEKWKEAATKSDADIFGFFMLTETVDGPLDEALVKMKAENKRIVLMPHEKVETTYRLRLAQKPLPEHLEDFLWPTVDPSKLMGLMNFHGFVATNVFTSGGPVVQHRPPHEESGVLLAARLVQEGDSRLFEEKTDEAFALYAQASLTASLPDAFFGLAMCAAAKKDAKEVIRMVERGFLAAYEVMHILEWRQKTFAGAARMGVLACLRKDVDDLDKAKQFLRIGQQADPTNPEWGPLVEKIEILESKRIPPSVGFDAEIPREIVESLIKIFDVPMPDAAAYEPWVYATAAGIPKTQRYPYVLPLDRRPSLDPTELAGLHRAQGLIAVSEFQAEQYRRAYPFLPTDFVKVCPLGFRPWSDVESSKAEGAWVGLWGAPNEVEQEILRRVRVDVPVLSEDGSIPMSQVFLHIPLDEPYHCEVVLQAQAAGAVPVVAGVGCLREFMKGGYVLKPPVTSEAFIDAAAKRIAHLLTHESDRLAVAEEGRRRVLTENTWEAVAPLWRKVFS